MIAETPCGALVIAETNGPDGRSAMIHADTLRCEALRRVRKPCTGVLRHRGVRLRVKNVFYESSIRVRFQLHLILAAHGVAHTRVLKRFHSTLRTPPAIV